jgi:GNAT superfamily N-acetyltransferase
MRFEYLADHLELLPRLARLHFDQWSYLRPHETLEVRTLRLHSYCGRTSVPTVVVALEGEALCGSAMLVRHEFDDRTDLTPWLDGVFVVPEFRCRGLGAALVERMATEARSLSIPALYLYTTDAEALYTRLGWATLERRPHRGEMVTVMSKQLAD